MTGDILSILAEAELPTESETLCLKGSLVAEFERLDARLRDLRTVPRTSGSLADPSPATDVAAQMAALRDQMLAYEVTFTFRAMPARQGSDFWLTEPERDKFPERSEFDAAYHVWACELMARSCADPVMTAEQADELSQKLSTNQWIRLSRTALRVNYGHASVPFSEAASALTEDSGASSTRPPEQESRAAGSLADPSPNEPSASTTPTTD